LCGWYAANEDPAVAEPILSRDEAVAGLLALYDAVELLAEIRDLLGNDGGEEEEAEAD
jgi:hypothetical protein